ncbi:MAG: nicotinate (nicotinamide) nucleotide adenylyltransferase [Oscillospiraceae bacterium]|nr:nicotinate (nicotinamide) nucleotide adenylyltransferase [Oscillospiraceae bacterium]
MGKIGVYGGSFNPPHKGHALAVQEMMRALALDRVILVPASVPPHKTLPALSPPPQARLELLRRMAEDIPGAEIDDLELRREGPSYTVDTVRALRARYPEDRLYLLMGTDMFLSFGQWRAPEEICRCAAIVTAHRAADPPAACRKLEEQAARVRERFGAEVTVLQNHVFEASSTEVRRMLRFQCAEAYLAPKVLACIREQGLYGVGECLCGLPFPQLRDASLALHDPKRVPHVAGCCATAARLARRWGADEALAARCGILHDVTKALGRTAQLLLCEKYGIMTSEFEKAHYKLLHSKTGAVIARRIFGECDAVYEAIYWHTTGKADMTVLEKILYLADYMEPNRDFDGVEKLRALAETDLDAALLCGFEMSIELLKSEGKPLDRYTVEARDFLVGERTKA